MCLAVLKKFICLFPILYKNIGSLTAFHNFESRTNLLALVSGILSEWFLICAVNMRMNLVGLHPVPTWDGLCEVSTILNHCLVN